MRFNWIKHLKIAALSMLVIFVVVAIANYGTFVLMFSNMSAMGEGAREARSMVTQEDLLAYFAENPEIVSIAVLDPENPEEGFYHAADDRRAIAGLPRLLVLSEFLRRVEAGEIDPETRIPVDLLRTYALPGIADAAHSRMLLAVSEEESLSLGDVAEGMIRYHDPAAADLILSLLGNASTGITERFGFPGLDSPVYNSGLFLGWTESSRDAAATPDGSYEATYALARAYAEDENYRADLQEHLTTRGAELSLRDQREHALATFPRGSAADYATLITRILAEDLVSPEADSRIRSIIETPLSSDEGGAAIGSGGGSFPGIISLAGYVNHPTGGSRVAVLLIENLPIGIYYHLMQTGLDRGLQLRLLLDDGFVEEARAVLGG